MLKVRLSNHLTLIIWNIHLKKIYSTHSYYFQVILFENLALSGIQKNTSCRVLTLLFNYKFYELRFYYLNRELEFTL